MTFLEAYSSPRKRTLLPAFGLVAVTGLVGWYALPSSAHEPIPSNDTAITTLRTLATTPSRVLPQTYASQEDFLATWRTLPKADRYIVLRSLLEESTREAVDQTRDTIEDHLGDLTLHFIGGGR